MIYVRVVTICGECALVWSPLNRVDMGETASFALCFQNFSTWISMRGMDLNGLQYPSAPTAKVTVRVLATGEDHGHQRFEWSVPDSTSRRPGSPDQAVLMSYGSVRVRLSGGAGSIPIPVINSKADKEAHDFAAWALIAARSKNPAHVRRRRPSTADIPRPAWERTSPLNPPEFPRHSFESPHRSREFPKNMR